jgi:hypothetical protein
MRRILAFALAFLLASSPAFADNYAATAGSGLTFAAKNIGGVLSPWWIPANSAGTELFTSGNAAYVQFPSAQSVTANPTTAASWAIAATGSSVPANSVFSGCRSANTEPTALTNGQLNGILCGLSGKLVELPYTVKELAVRGTATTTSNTAVTLLAANASFKTYVTSAECWNSSAVSVTVTFNDSEGTGSGTILFLPAGGGNNARFVVPLVTAAVNTAVTFTPSASETTIGCNAQGYYGN